jgi:hypothetical protein
MPNAECRMPNVAAEVLPFWLLSAFRIQHSALTRFAYN